VSLYFLSKHKDHQILNLYLFPNHLECFSVQQEDLVINEFRISLGIH
jgi:hypothetical protein